MVMAMAIIQQANQDDGANDGAVTDNNSYQSTDPEKMMMMMMVLVMNQNNGSLTLSLSLLLRRI